MTASAAGGPVEPRRASRARRVRRGRHFARSTEAVASPPRAQQLLHHELAGLRADAAHGEIGVWSFIEEAIGAAATRAK
jgi:hypothetical protein